MEKNKFTHGSLFSGIGGPEIAAEEMGWKNMFHCEINPFGRKILDYWFHVQPYGKDKNGKDKYHTYRRKDVLAFRKKYADDLLRPVFDWSAQQVIDYILENGIQPNPLYRMGYKRVGCFPCVMASQQDIYNISVQEPERISYIAGLEQQFNSSFFGPDKISSKYYKGEYPLISDVVRYVQSKRAGGSLFDDDVATSCMSYYGLCE